MPDLQGKPYHGILGWPQIFIVVEDDLECLMLLLPLSQMLGLQMCASVPVLHSAGGQAC